MEGPNNSKEDLPRFELVRATEADLDAYIALEKTVGNSKTYSAMTEPADALREIRDTTVYFIKRGETVLGDVAYEIKSPNHAYISGLLIHPDSRGQGLARAAMEKVLEEIADKETIDLVTHPDNATAIALYESVGFEIGERKENYFGDGEPRIVMTLKRQKEKKD